MTTVPTILGIDLGKNWFHLIGLDERGATVLRKKLNRGQLAAYAATAPRGVVATEACPGSQYWGRVFAQAGHEVRILPAQFVKPYVKANKNDFHDAHTAHHAPPAAREATDPRTEVSGAGAQRDPAFPKCTGLHDVTPCHRCRPP